MTTSASLYNGELGTPQVLFFHHPRALFVNKCLDSQRMLRVYVELDFLDRDLYVVLGQSAGLLSNR